MLVENTAEERLTYRRGCNHFLLFSKTSSYFNIFNLARTQHKFTKFLLSFFSKVKVLCRSARLFNPDLNKLAGTERAPEDSAADDGGGLWFCFERKRLDLTKGCQSHHRGSECVQRCGCVCEDVRKQELHTEKCTV